MALVKKPTPSAKATAKRSENYDASIERVPGERWITMGNALTRSGQGLTLAEKRVVGCALSKMDSRKAVPIGTIPTTRINATEYAEAFGIDLDTAYNQLQSAANQLYKRSITFYQAASSRQGKPLPPTRVQMRWVGRVHYQKGEGWVELYWWPELLPQLTGLRKKFTSYQLQQASALRSIYSWRLLELLTRFQDTGWLEITIEDFAQSMDATEKQMANFAAIRRRIIEPAVKELTEKDGWLIDWRAIKKGRKVAMLRFDFKKNNQLRLEV
ncbi:replication protein [Pseudomonas savastanoi pv. glycinea str. race 4]|nr:replication protein [Pseudomonas savastanoi pv. glycinea str. race 4]